MTTLQTALFDASAPRARATDPLSSVTAARSVNPGVPELILDVLRSEPGHAWTADEIEAALVHAGRRVRQNTLRGAVSRMFLDGKLIDAGMGESDAGCPMRRYRIAS